MELQLALPPSAQLETPPGARSVLPYEAERALPTPTKFSACRLPSVPKSRNLRHKTPPLFWPKHKSPARIFSLFLTPAPPTVNAFVPEPQHQKSEPRNWRHTTSSKQVSVHLLQRTSPPQTRKSSRQSDLRNDALSQSQLRRRPLTQRKQAVGAYRRKRLPKNSLRKDPRRLHYQRVCPTRPQLHPVRLRL